MTVAGMLAFVVIAQSNGGGAPSSTNQVGPPVPPGLIHSVAAASNSIWMWIAMAIIGAGVILFIVAARALLRRRGVEPAPEEAYLGDEATEPAAPKSMPPALRSAELVEAQRLFTLMGDAEELVGRLSLQISENAARLERLITAADERISRLQSLASSVPPVHTPGPSVAFAPAPIIQPPLRAPQSPAPGAAPAPPSVAAPAPFSSPAVPRTPAPSIVTRPLRSPSLVAAAVSQAAANTRPSQPGGSASSPAPAPSPMGIDPLTNEIYRLADDGVAVVDIAKQLGQHTGKVELILALRQR